MKPLRILVTGFGPFPGTRVNPSAELACRLARSRRFARGPHKIRAAVLATRYDEIEARLPALIGAADVVLMIGLAARARMVRVEERGIAHASRTAPDAGGRAAMLLPNRTMRVRKTNAPVAACVAALERSRLRACRSIDAGRYLCNAGYFAALSHARKDTLLLFVHVPAVAPAAGTLPRRRTRKRKPGLANLERGLSAILAQLISARQRLASRNGTGSDGLSLVSSRA